MRNLNIALVLIFTFFQTAEAQFLGNDKVKGNGKITTVKRTTADYDKIYCAGWMDFVLVKGEEGKLEIKGESNLIPYIETKVSKGKLILRVKKGVQIKPSFNKSIYITIPFENIESVALAGSGDVVGNDLISAKEFNSSLSGSGDMLLKIQSQRVKASLAGSGDITLKGETGYVKASLAGSGDIHAFDLIAENVDATVSGSGDVDVYCSSKLKATIAGSGDITYKGNPKVENSKVVGSGDVSSFE